MPNHLIIPHIGRCRRECLRHASFSDHLFQFTRNAVLETVRSSSPSLPFEALEAARALAPGRDVYALEADWRAYWARSSRQPLRAPQAAFLGFVKKAVTKDLT